MLRMSLAMMMMTFSVTHGAQNTAAVKFLPNSNIKVYGALRAMFHEGQTGTVVTLDQVLPNPNLYAVGALSDLSGEITILAGQVFLDFPEGDSATRTEIPVQSAAGASLLVTAEITEWQSITLNQTVRFEDIDEVIATHAEAAGMDLDSRFPFLMQGDFEDLSWHVIDGTRLKNGATSHLDHLAAAVTMQLDSTTATLIGFYSNNDHGVFTHMDSATHIHCVTHNPLYTGHMDNVLIPEGTILKFPVKSSGL